MNKGNKCTFRSKIEFSHFHLNFQHQKCPKYCINIPRNSVPFNIKVRKKIREPVKNVLADFSVKGVPPPPTPLTENHFAKKPLAERGGTPAPLNGKLPKMFLKNGPKRAKIGVFWPKIAVF